MFCTLIYTTEWAFSGLVINIVKVNSDLTEQQMATNSWISDDIIVVEILPRLPVKSFLKFRSVSKSWRSLISSNQFTKNHLKNYSKSHQRFMLYDQLKLEHCTLESMFTNEPLLHETDTNLFDSSKRLFSVMGSCDGLICIALDKKDLILWNPSTRNFRKLPPFGFDTLFGYFETCGLGFDEHSDDYKVVVFYNDTLKIKVKVYSLRTNEWRSVGNLKITEFVDEPPVFANGKLHWSTYSTQEIVCFDLETEEYGVLKVPGYLKIQSCVGLGLCASEGCLYVLSHATDVWVVGGYELGKLTCTKLATIPYTNYDVCERYRRLVHVKKNGEILLRSGQRLGVFNAIDCSFRWLDLSAGSFREIAYVESLVSPFVR